LIPGIHRDMLDGTILHFLPVDANVILLDRWNLVGEGSYGKIFKCCIFRVDFIPRHEIYVCKVFKNSDEGDATTSRNKEAISCPLSHPIFMKIFAIHPTKPHGYMRWWNTGTLRNMVHKCNISRFLEKERTIWMLNYSNVYKFDCLGLSYTVCFFCMIIIFCIVIYL
jgi:hypothetical protein